MKKINRDLKVFFAVVLAALFFMNIKVFAEETNYKIWETKNNIESNKVWTIKFNYPIDIHTIESNVKVVEKETKKSKDIKVSCNENGKSLKVVPLKKYENMETYTLLIEKGLKTKEGKKIDKPIKFDFTIKNENEIEKVWTEKDINSYDEFYKAIKETLENFETKVIINIKNYDSDKYKIDILNNIIETYPEMDYGYNGANANIVLDSNGNAKMTMNIEYQFSRDYMKKMKADSEEKVKEIINKIIKPDMTEYEKELVLHDYIVNNSKYDKRLFTNNMPNESYTDYGILVNGVGVCSGYAKAIYRLMKGAGIECIYVTGEADDGTGRIPHAWNIVKIEGEYYHLDITFDDPITYNGKNILTYNYFNLTDGKISQDHIWNTNIYPKCTSTRYSYYKK
ncbi:Ig-like domain-containing protein [Clostridium aestuarii]|uniref:Ig-like domain-containing protein n=1 Tax=Clostridium aestuarii TaxID=338193 RepID=A0ABT4D570_9CLOT|nr:transglutaminase domain-containing protein [Clostridium aestuarii]MCY6485183.1 Ig-like domain-containing protein [Clostridium aestuarii]